MALGPWGLAAAQEQPYPIDVELVRPVLTVDGGYGVDSPRVMKEGTWIFGPVVQYERAPLRIYEYRELLGNVVAHRTMVYLGGDFAVSNSVSGGIGIPVGFHVGSDVPELAGDGVGLGDISLSLRWSAGNWGPVTLGALVAGTLPTGARLKYMGERRPRLRTGLLGHVEMPGFDVIGNALLHVRAPIETEHDFIAGSELELNLGLRVPLPDGRTDLRAEWLTRAGIAFGSFGGRVSSEVLLGVRHQPSPGARIDLALGRGLSAGYGTSAFRILAGVTFTGAPPEPEPEPDVVFEFTRLPPEDMAEENEMAAEVVPPPETPPEWAEGQLARRDVEEIVIKDPIQFAVGTTSILESSMSVVEQVSELLEGDATIGHLVIEGHASSEGTFEYNYELSMARAKAIYEELIRQGVHPSRMSFRAMGEVVSIAEGEDGEPNAADRRVQFLIVRQYAPGETIPEYPSEIRLPWSGEPHTVTNPIPPDLPDARRNQERKQGTAEESSPTAPESDDAPDRTPPPTSDWFTPPRLDEEPDPQTDPESSESSEPVPRPEFSAPVAPSAPSAAPPPVPSRRPPVPTETPAAPESTPEPSPPTRVVIPPAPEVKPPTRVVMPPTSEDPDAETPEPEPDLLEPDEADEPDLLEPDEPTDAAAPAPTNTETPPPVKGDAEPVDPYRWGDEEVP